MTLPPRQPGDRLAGQENNMKKKAKPAVKPDASVRTEGRRFSKREVIVHEVDGQQFEFVKIDFREGWSAGTIKEHCRHACKVLESEGIDVKGLLADAPHGSRVRDYVLNYLEREPDSRVGLAARILELCLHVLALLDMGGVGKVVPGYAHRLARLTMLAGVYELETERQRFAGKGRGRQQRRDREKRRAAAGIDQRGTVAKLIQALAPLRDEMGDYLPPRDLWPLLYSEMDRRQLRPNEITDAADNPLRIDYQRGDRPDQITFASFKVMVSEAHKKVKQVGGSRAAKKP